MIAKETYRLTLRHEIFDEEGKRYPLDEPITIEYYILLDNKIGSTVILNEMMDKLKAELLARKGE